MTDQIRHISQEFLPLGFKVLSELAQPSPTPGVLRGSLMGRDPYTFPKYREIVERFTRFGWRVVMEKKSEKIASLIREGDLLHIMIAPLEDERYVAVLEAYDDASLFAGTLHREYNFSLLGSDATRILETLGELAKAYPTQRFGQLLMNALRSNAKGFPFNDTDGYERNIKLFSLMFRMQDGVMLDALESALGKVNAS